MDQENGNIQDDNTGIEMDGEENEGVQNNPPLQEDQDDQEAEQDHNDEIEMEIVDQVVDAAHEELQAVDDAVDEAHEAQLLYEEAVDEAVEQREEEEVAEVLAALPPPQVEQEQHLESVDYDIAIPSQHSYLDMPMHRVEGCNYWLEGQTVNLFMVPLDVMVIPGQTFPLRIRDSTLQFAMIRSLLDGNHNTFGAVHMPAEREQMYLVRSWSQFGVTVQIVEISEDTPSEIVLKCRGRQRFRTLKTHRYSNTNLHATVSILADHIPSRVVDPAGRLRECFASSGLPPWIYKVHDVYTIMDKIRKEISKVSRFVKLDVAPQEPDMFSYWLISAMPFKFNQRVQMLRENNLVVRLLSQLTHLRRLSEFDYCCELCGIAIVCSSHLISMSTDGPFFVNPTGNPFELVTAYSIQNALSNGSPTERDSWFPGYAWSYLYCTNCMSFLGWKFSSVDPSRQPPVFYGLQRNAVRVLEDEVEPVMARNSILLTQ